MVAEWTATPGELAIRPELCERNLLREGAEFAEIVEALAVSDLVLQRSRFPGIASLPSLTRRGLGTLTYYHSRGWRVTGTGCEVDCLGTKEHGQEHGCAARDLLGGFFFCGGYEFRVRSFEVFDLARVEMPDAGGYFVDYVMVVGDEQHRPVVFLQRDVERVDGF
jgi:hypothetical protein